MDKEYIERNGLMRQIRMAANRTSLGETGVPNLHWTDVVGFIFDAPVENVEPKSEVDLYKKQVDELEDELASTYDKLENVKAEVMIEIFDEIDTEICNELEKADDETIIFNYACIVDRALNKLREKYIVANNE